ncbi:NADH:flavin oxidoreductase/NADH oxidase [Pedobacter flavus]|uniref:NADH:flavin oxidoreductase/NADH oxidase n=1 Tax=Pedobacter flavus TaxID=3113906 RepID=A0ABU7GXM2_9SPHI|nr:NADH:flavin oxidoreductase/NADH oxidase [Pedobacter sp. VNH31]MEE1883805.1 NADH:flavin oxidoreductase/NADH oxidase [Pedobacter sp. VNH31]
MSILFSKLPLKKQVLQTRLVVSPMCQYSAVEGHATNWHLVHLGQFAIGKASTIIQEATAVLPEGRISYGDLGLWKDEHIPALKEIVDFVHEQGALIGIQLAHAGRKASTEKPWISRSQLAPTHENGWQTVGPSAMPFHEKDHPPIAIATEDIKNIVQAFQNAAKRAVSVGYDIIEIHGAHGYLIHQFLSPLTNLRTDAYGGSFENRSRLLVEIIEAVKTVLEEQSLWLRISATDWAEGGWDIEEAVKLAKLVESMGVEVIDVSSGGNVHHQNIHVKENYQVPFAERIKAETNLVTGTVGLIKNAQQAETILKEQKADLIFIGRAYLQNPHLTTQFARDLGVDIEWLPQYERGKETL